MAGKTFLKQRVLIGLESEIYETLSWFLFLPNKAISWLDLIWFVIVSGVIFSLSSIFQSSKELALIVIKPKVNELWDLGCMCLFNSSIDHWFIELPYKTHPSQAHGLSSAHSKPVSYMPSKLQGLESFRVLKVLYEIELLKSPHFFSNKCSNIATSSIHYYNPK